MEDIRRAQQALEYKQKYREGLTCVFLMRRGSVASNHFFWSKRAVIGKDQRFNLQFKAFTRVLNFYGVGNGVIYSSCGLQVAPAYA